MTRPASFLPPAAWSALLLASQAATLQWVHAGKAVGYQHLLPLGEILGGAPRWTLMVVAAQLLAVAFAMARKRPVLPFHLRGWQWLGLALAFVLTSATLSREPSVYLGELALASMIQGLQLVTVLLLASSIPAGGLRAFGNGLDRLLGPAHHGVEQPIPGRPDRFACIVALAVGVAAIGLATWSYQLHPHVPDEVVYLLQARYFAAGHLSLPVPPVPAAFDTDLMFTHGGRWFSPVPPGWPMILAVGVRLGVPWLVNPVLAGVNILLASMLFRELYPQRTARTILLLFAASPWQLFMSMNLMTHTATLTAALAAAVAVARLQRQASVGLAIVAGAGIGVAGLIRPLTAVAVAVLLGLWSLRARGRRLRFGPAATVTLVATAVGALILPYNKALMGSARTFPIMAYTDALYGPGTNALGFGANRGMPWPGLDPFPGHGPLDVLINANFNLFQINIELLGWATGSILVLALLFGGWRLRGPDWGMAAVIGMIAGIHSFYYFSGGPDFGARYWYLTILPCLALTARGLEALATTLERQQPDTGLRIPAAAAALTAAAVLVFVPWRATDKYFHYRGMQPGLREVATAPAMMGSVFLVRGHRHPDFASAAVFNPLDLTSSDPIFTWDRGEATRRALVAAYPGREFYLVEGPTVTGSGFTISAGPMLGAALLARRDSLIP